MYELSWHLLHWINMKILNIQCGYTHMSYEFSIIDTKSHCLWVTINLSEKRKMFKKFFLRIFLIFEWNLQHFMKISAEIVWKMWLHLMEPTTMCSLSRSKKKCPISFISLGEVKQELRVSNTMSKFKLLIIKPILQAFTRSIGICHRSRTTKKNAKTLFCWIFQLTKRFYTHFSNRSNAEDLLITWKLFFLMISTFGAD